MSNKDNLMTLRDIRCRLEKRTVEQRMKIFSGNVSAVARSLDISRNTVIRILGSKHKQG